ncbi:hypothetical protein AB0M23_15280 [Streptomyces sp. NPDC052077]|uniref:hypothetical protein n=1 Tax=Streptomyces sp. NPDC052077 TaxID=3154757 RepID=UPI00342ED916
MHHHGYVWTGPKARFDEEALRRPPYQEPPPAGSHPELARRYREVAAGFADCDLPPLETADWLLKPRSLVRGTWSAPGDAALWLRERLAEFGSRFASAADREPHRLEAVARAAEARLRWGGDVSLGHYLERPAFLSLALVACPRGPGARHRPCPLASGPPPDDPGRGPEPGPGG